jgi:hypothetical protein
MSPREHPKLAMVKTNLREKGRYECEMCGHIGACKEGVCLAWRLKTRGGVDAWRSIAGIPLPRARQRRIAERSSLRIDTYCHHGEFPLTVYSDIANRAAVMDRDKLSTTGGKAVRGASNLEEYRRNNTDRGSSSEILRHVELCRMTSVLMRCCWIRWNVRDKNEDSSASVHRSVTHVPFNVMLRFVLNLAQSSRPRKFSS